MFDFSILDSRLCELDNIEASWDTDLNSLREQISELQKAKEEFEKIKPQLLDEVKSLEAELADIIEHPEKYQEQKPEPQQTPQEIKNETPIPEHPPEKSPEQDHAPEVKPEAPSEPLPAPSPPVEQKLPEPEPQIAIPIHTEAAPAKGKHKKKKTKASDTPTEGPIELAVKYTLSSHFDTVRGVLMHPSSPLLVSISDDGTMKYTNIEPPKPAGKRNVRTKPTLYRSARAHGSTVTAIAGIGSQLFTGDSDGTLCLWDNSPPPPTANLFTIKGRANNHLQHQFEISEQPVWGIAAHPRSLFAVCGSADHRLTFIDLEKFTKEPVEVKGSPAAMSFNADGNEFGVTFSDNTFSIYSEKVEKCQIDLQSQGFCVCAFEGGYAIGCEDGRVRFVEDGAISNTLEVADAPITGVCVAGGNFVASSHNGHVKAFKLPDLELAFDEEIGGKKFGMGITSISARDDPASPYVAVGCADGTVVVLGKAPAKK